MKIKQICMLVLLWLGVIPAVQAQTFDKLWKQVEQAEKKSLPQTVIKLTGEIYQKGEAEKNSPQMLKAYMWRMKYRDMLTPDSLYTNVKELEQWAKQADKPMDRAILHSLIAGIYANYAANNQWQLRQRTEIVGEAPSADMREWTANMFVEKVKTSIKEAMADSVLLLNTSSRTYIPFVELGETSEYYHHDMYHLLAFRSIEALQQIEGLDRATPVEAYSEDTSSKKQSPVKQDIERIYENMLISYKAKGDKEGCLLTNLNYLSWKRDSSKSFREPFSVKKGGTYMMTVDPYETGLDALKTEYKSSDLCAEVYLAQANYMIGKEQQTVALQLCDESIRLYPGYRRINALKNLREDILSPSLNVTAAATAFPGEEIKIRASHKNLDGFTLRLFQAKKLIKEQHFAVLRPEDYRTQDTVFTFQAPEVGEYVMRIIPDIRAKRDSESKFNVTRFKALTCRLPGNQYEVVTLDGQTGHPIPNAKVTLYTNDEKLLQEFTTGTDGKVVFPWKSDYRYLKAAKGADTAMPLQGVYGGSYGYYGDENKALEQMTLLTDRSLYRPGQTVYVKGIAYTQKADTANVLPNKEYTVILTDANNQEVGQKKVRTNEFGSFATDFALPSACLNGMFSLIVGNSRTSIRVEDYKRPTFDITFEKQAGSYQLGDQIEVKGKIQSYSGVLLQDLPVKYTVKRSAFSLWRFAESTQIASGEVTANENGEFTIPVRLEENDVYKNDARVYYRYSVEATATNVAGETQSSTDVISAGNRSLVLQTELSDKICKDKPFHTVFKVQNLNGQPVEVKGTFFLYQAKDADFKKLDEKPVATGTFTSNEEMTIHWGNLPSGPYVLKAVVKDGQGKEVTADANTILFAWEDKRPPVETPVWFYEANTEFDATHPAKFCFGTSEKDAYVMMNVFSGNELLESKVMNLSDTIVHFYYPYKESYGDGVFINFCLVRDGQVYQEQVRLKKRLPDKTLTMKWEVFRDKLRPGQKEEWKLTIHTPQGQAAEAEMLATMYDASLDKIWNRKQNFSIYYNQIIPYSNWMSGYFGNNSFNYWWNHKYLKVPAMEFDHFVTQGMGSIEEALNGRVPGVMVRGYGVQKQAAMTGNIMIRGVSSRSKAEVKYVGSVAEDMELSADRAEAGKPDGASEEETLPEAPADLRTNLAETAFFYPQLRTNEQGEVSFSFTMPESLTRWNFRGYSHTKGMLMGTLDGEATTSKEFMLTPNLPRFVRVGDKTSVAASISNMTGKPQAGTVSMILFDPMTEKVISTQKQKFTVEAGKTIGVSFMFTVSDKYEILGCRMIADSGTFSDGEQQLLPVLSNKEHLVETLPMPVRGEETRTFSLDSLFNHHSKTATDRKLTVEFTGNPAWYAIQALPSLSLPENNNAISWATAYYANTLASYIMNSQPRIKAVFDSWKLQGGTKDTFLSNLQKNQEVKNILLSESPWVLEAQTEEQQKERIATLFDLNNIRSNNIAALTRLQELQNSSGAWSWYKGMTGSRYVTTYIAELNARLAMMTGEQPSGTALALQKNAFTYLHQEALKEYREILKAQKDGVKFTGVSGSILQYLYLIALSGEQVPASNKAAYTYYLSKIGEMLPTASMDTKAIAAIILDKAGRKKEAQEFIASLKEHLTKTDEQGMFFAFNENPYTWGGMKMQAHVDVMEALELTGGNNDTVEEMKLWLLKQKQTQQWNSPVATADAVYALLMKGVNLLDNQGDVRIVIAKEVLETVSPSKTTVPGLGYIKRSFTQKNVVDARKIEVEKRNPGIAWGAVYAEYESPIKDVRQQGGELNVQKQLYVERMVNNAPQLQPITEKTALQVGDKVVSRLSIRADRPMDFVQLKDQRGACFEPIGSVSGYNWSNGIGYYVDIKDASTNFFFDHLGKGVYVLEHSYRISRAGTYETGLATMQCAYAPEYASHSASMTIIIK
ncbi:alpha-2-macroglobulin family protein [Bacteroides thetaiotaomicron]|uniref:alpha-2-macroglobulin family protein n=1 Tax=Bacteroides thetaiotaomicron TaxID=818 RepID=UPI001CE24312|nr:alpha-2-macroglobulin family protein [Bacteroides thetaiotaomicron]MCA6007505.1 alpha-2-macroglobulin [Bacteroides thetaiotaomicron]